LIEALDRRGIDSRELCRDLRIAQQELNDVDGRIEARCYLDLWREVARVTGAVGIALEVAQEGGDVHNLLRFVCMTASDLGEAIERLRRHIGLLADAVSIDLVHANGRLVLRFGRARRSYGAAPASEERLVDEFTAAEIVSLARSFTGMTDWSPQEIRFVSSRPSHAPELSEFFRCPITYDAEAVEIVVDMVSLAIPLKTREPAAARFFESVAEHRLAQKGEVRRLRAAVEEAIRERLAPLSPSVTEVARHLAMSERTLRRRLDEEGTTYQRVLDELRQTIARQLVFARLPITEIAHRLGFSDVTAFHRAFRRWTGTTPVAFAQLISAPTEPQTLVG
jgi:AraC-like DNA-binding protein